MTDRPSLIDNLVVMLNSYESILRQTSQLVEVAASTDFINKTKSYQNFNKNKKKVNIMYWTDTCI